jgi:hypothetical protein
MPERWSHGGTWPSEVPAAALAAPPPLCAALIAPRLGLRVVIRSRRRPTGSAGSASLLRAQAGFAEDVALYGAVETRPAPDGRWQDCTAVRGAYSAHGLRGPARRGR